MFVPAKLTVIGVFNQLREIASMSGNAVSIGVVLIQKKIPVYLSFSSHRLSLTSNRNYQ